MKTTFEFDDEHTFDIKLCTHRMDLYFALDELKNYRRQLYKYESRGEIPVNELINELDSILADFYKLGLDD